MTADSIAMYAAVVLSLAFSYVPSADGWWANLAVTYKRLVMLGLLLLVALASVGLACAGFAADLGLTITCDRSGIVGIVQAFGLAVIANQAAYKITPQSAAKS
jgi:hypothetical protein